MKDSMKSHDASRWFISEPDSVDDAISGRTRRKGHEAFTASSSYLVR